MSISNSIHTNKPGVEPDNIFGHVALAWRRSLKLFAIILLVSGGAGLILAWVQKPVYISNLTFALDDEGLEQGNTGVFIPAGETNIQIGITGNIFSNNNIAEIMASRRIIEESLLSECEINNSKIKLIEYYLNESGIRKKIFADKDLRETHFSTGLRKDQLNEQQSKVLFIVYSDFKKNKLSILKLNKQLFIYRVQFSGFSETFSKLFTEKLIENTNSYYTEIRVQKTRDIVEKIEQRISDLRGKIDGSLVRGAMMQDANINLALQEPKVPVEKERISKDIYEKTLQELSASLEIARFNYLNKIPLLQIIDKVEFPLKKQKPKGPETAGVLMFTATILYLLFLGIRNEMRRKLRDTQSLSVK